MKTTTILFCLFLTLLSHPCKATNLIGSIVPPYPVEWKSQGGACIGGSLGIERSCDYSIGIIEKSGQLHMYFGKSAPRIDPKKARWFVTDQMLYPKTPAGFHVVYGLCERDGKSDETIIAIVKTTDTEWYTNVKSAYRANLSTGRFEKTSIKGIRCVNEGWGV